MTCWSANPEQRWDLHAVCNQFSISSVQDVPGVELGKQCASQIATLVEGLISMFIDPQSAARNLNAIGSSPPRDLSPVPSSGHAEGNYGSNHDWPTLIAATPTDRTPPDLSNHRARQPIITRLLTRLKNRSLQKTPTPSTPSPKNHLTSRTRHRTSRDNNEPRTDIPAQGKRIRKNGMLSRGWNKLQTMVNVLTRAVRLGKFPGD